MAKPAGKLQSDRRSYSAVEYVPVCPNDFCCPSDCEAPVHWPTPLHRGHR